MTTSKPHTVASLLEASNNKSEVESLQLLTEIFPNQVSFSTSLGYEDQAITHIISANSLPIRIFTLDTGR